MLHSVPQLLCRVFSSVERNRSGSLPEKFDGWRCPCRENVRPKDLNCFEVVEVVQGGCRGRARIIFGILQPAPDEPYSGDVHQKSTCVLEGGGGGERESLAFIVCQAHALHGVRQVDGDLSARAASSSGGFVQVCYDSDDEAAQQPVQPPRPPLNHSSLSVARVLSVECLVHSCHDKGGEFLH